MNPFDRLSDDLDTTATPVPYDSITGPDEFIASWHGQIETVFAESGFYGGHDNVRPYPGPTTLLSDPPLKKPPVVNAQRRLWFAKFNPDDDTWVDDDGKRTNDPVDPAQFPWRNPEMATKNGWWLSTDRTPRSRLAIEDLAVGDLVLVQRSAKNPDRVDNVPHRSIIGLAVAWGDRSWNDVSTGERHRDVCLVPLSFFRYPVPVQTAQGSTWGRLKDVPSIRDMPQLHGKVTTHGRTLSAVNWDDIAEICSVCNLHPDIFTDPIPTVAARLSITPTGNKDLWRFRWDHIFKNDLRLENARRGVRSARDWATSKGLVEVSGLSDCQDRRLVGYDFRFYDAHGTAVQVEIKGYSTRDLAKVHLQPSQVARARDAAAGNPPEWYLHVLLGARSKNPQAETYRSAEAIELVDRGLLNRRHAPNL